MKGFRDKNDNSKFHPITDYKGVSKSRDQSAKTEGVKIRNKKETYETRQYKVWKYDDAPQEVQEKILENYKEKYVGQDNFFIEDDGILYGKNKKGQDIIGYEIFKNNRPKYFNVGYGHMWAQFDLDIKDDEKFRKSFQIPKSTWDKIEVSFTNDRDESNTEIRFYDNLNGDTIDPYEPYPDYYDNLNEDEKSDALTQQEWVELERAKTIFIDFMDETVSNLNRAYEWQFADEHIIDEIRINDYKFTEDGELD